MEVTDAGRGPAARVLAAVLARSHLAVTSPGATLGLPRDTTFTTSVVIVGGDATVASRVEGDVVVVGGNLFLRPGARIAGRAIAIGGGVYDSFLARVDGGRTSFRDVTYDARLDGGRALLAQRRLDVRSVEPLVWPGVYGLRIPTYDRAAGLSLGAGPRLTFGSLPVAAEPAVTYRSHLGDFDPSILVEVGAGRPVWLEARAERGVYTNDAWSRPDVLNSAATLVFGDDERNHYRADRVEAAIAARRTWDLLEGTARIRVLAEDASSLGPRPGESSEPWSMLGRDDTTRMLRPNPAVRPGRITSVGPQLAATWSDGEMSARATLGVEIPLSSVQDLRFVQSTADVRVSFPAVSNHLFEGHVHVVHTAGDAAPPQRWAYLGGGSTLPTRDELSLGGDQLFFAEGLYEVPLRGPELPFVGAPTVGVRYAVGSAGVDRLPDLTQNVALLVRVSLLRVEVVVDPADGTTAVRFGGSAFR